MKAVEMQMRHSRKNASTLSKDSLNQRFHVEDDAEEEKVRSSMLLKGKPRGVGVKNLNKSKEDGVTNTLATVQ